MANPILNQEAFRFRHDNGGEASDGALWIAAANTAIPRVMDINTRLRFSISNTGDMDKNNLQCQLQYNQNGGGWFSVNATSSVARMSDSIGLIDGEDTTQQLGNTLIFDTSNNGQNDTSGRTASNTLTLATRIEIEYCFQVRSADILAFDTIDFRVTAPGAILDNYNTPTVRLVALDIPIIPGSMIIMSGTGSMTIDTIPRDIEK